MGSSLAFTLKEGPVICAKVCNKSWVILLYWLPPCYHQYGFAGNWGYKKERFLPKNSVNWMLNRVIAYISYTFLFFGFSNCFWSNFFIFEPKVEKIYTYGFFLTDHRVTIRWPSGDHHLWLKGQDHFAHGLAEFWVPHDIGSWICLV